MPTNVEDFEQQLFTIGVKLGEDTDKIVRKVALQSLTTITFATPVDTGAARRNWLVSVDAPKVNPIEDVDPSGATTIAEGNQVIQSAEFGKVIFISNNLPYIERLNEGYSAQAPANFVQISVQAAVQSVRGVQVL